MSRLEEALRRSRRGTPDPESFNVPSPRALDWFPGGDGRDVATEPPAIVAPAESQPSADRPAATLAVPHPQAEEPGLEKALHVATPFAEHLILPHADVPASAVEQYRRVAAVLHHQSERGIKVVMIASAMPAEGKTLTALNLALTLGESYRKRVLLIDADLRRPMVHEAFGLPNSAGLTSMLSAAEGAPLQVVSITQQLAIVPTGGHEHDPMGSLTSDRMRRVIRDASEAFDWVLIDTPPVALLPDAKLLSGMVDAAVLVVRAGRTPLKAIQHAIDAIGRPKILGVVLNRVEDAIGKQYAGEYYSYYTRAEATNKQ